MPRTPDHLVDNTIGITGGGAGSSIHYAAANGAIASMTLGEPEEIAERLLFTCWNACEYIAANTVHVNGGDGFR